LTKAKKAPWGASSSSVLGAARGAPVPPAVGRLHGRGVAVAEQGLPALLLFLDLVEHPQEQDPGQRRDILNRAGDVAATHDVADRLDRLIDGLAGGQGLGHGSTLVTGARRMVSRGV
jgi:hypothetical protein